MFNNMCVHAAIACCLMGMHEISLNNDQHKSWKCSALGANTFNMAICGADDIAHASLCSGLLSSTRTCV